MGTRADFYVGRGVQAEWLGSIAWDGYPDGIDESVTKAGTEIAFRNAVGAFLTSRKDASLPEQGWPWPWDTSSTTDYAYAFDGDKVYASCFGGAWFDPLAEAAEEPEGNEGEAATFPDMKARKAVAWGQRSGVIVVGG